ncbi:DUF2116 family Zn-ribbon domain-containing protein [Nocardioides donggukensis]|uniref:DUF2116 family Zn-ribbon domain-containing protein n=1 Tax=Nocardioides donggukensis TaxID=2774019 RepID=A0A927Q0Q6_9ACTN|nr:DUF2116 family Zn-ribbon domain-containing protein [Nocardioides donggukensis]MBD8870930.1 DUF2116 family Zn-ribbon domain-containing protein [Nocardioides donggukensis]
MSEHQPSSGDFTAEDQAATSDPFVAFVTTYSRMTATPEETDAMLDRAYGKGRHPGYEGRRWDRGEVRSPREPEPHGACEQCGEPLTWGFRFCSQECWNVWRAEQKPDPPTPSEMLVEMQAALDELRTYIEGRE